MEGTLGENDQKMIEFTSKKGKELEQQSKDNGLQRAYFNKIKESLGQENLRA